MIRVQDFTKLPEGRIVPIEGRVVRCPRCGRNGIEEHPVVSLPYCLHVQVLRLLPDGMRDEAVDCCSLGPSPN